jgi:hypothetical protein
MVTLLITCLGRWVAHPNLLPSSPSFICLLCQPLVRMSSCWTLGQYANMIGSDDTLLPGVLAVILPACLDHTKKVQEAALVALTAYINNAEELIVPFIQQILAVFSVGFSKYQARNCHVLYDAVAALSGTCLTVCCRSLAAPAFPLHLLRHTHTHTHSSLITFLLCKTMFASDVSLLLLLLLLFPMPPTPCAVCAQRWSARSCRMKSGRVCCSHLSCTAGTPRTMTTRCHCLRSSSAWCSSFTL